MGDYLSQTTLNITPSDYKIQLNNFMIYVLPARYKSIHVAMTSQMKDVATLGVSSVFYPTNTKIKGGKIIIKGTTINIRRRKIHSSNKTVFLGFRILNGRFFISSIMVK
jgi:hypothetical protein